MQVHQQVIVGNGAYTPFTALVAQVLQRMRVHLEQRDRQAVGSGDPLLHAGVQAGIDRMEDHPLTTVEEGDGLIARIAASDEPVRRLLNARYRHQLSGEALAIHAGVPLATLGCTLMEARDRVSGKVVDDDRQPQGPLPALIDDYLNGELDGNSHDLLIRLTQQLDVMTSFLHQHRQHLLLCAAYTALPFSPSSQVNDLATNPMTAGRREGSRAAAKRRASAPQRSVRAGREPSGSRVPLVVMLGVLALVVGVAWVLGRGGPQPVPNRTQDAVTTSVAVGEETARSASPPSPPPALTNVHVVPPQTGHAVWW